MAPVLQGDGTGEGLQLFHSADGVLELTRLKIRLAMNVVGGGSFYARHSNIAFLHLNCVAVVLARKSTAM